MPEVGEIALGGQARAESTSEPFSGGQPEVVYVAALSEFSPTAQEAFPKRSNMPPDGPPLCYAEVAPSGRLLVLDPDGGTRWETEGWQLSDSGISKSPHIMVSVPAGTHRDIYAYVSMNSGEAWAGAAERESRGGSRMSLGDLRRQFSPTVRFNSDNEGNLRVMGAGEITAVREGDGDGDAVREGGWGHAFRLGGGRGDALRIGNGFGTAFRDDDGDGDALRTGHGGGDAVRDGSGNGDAYKSGRGFGNARRGGSGDGDSTRTGDGMGSSTRNGSGNGKAIRSGDGDGDATKLGEGDGFAERRGAGNGDAVAERHTARKLGEGKGLVKVRCWPEHLDAQHERSDRVVEMSVLDPLANEYRLVARYDGRKPTADEIEQHAEDNYPHKLPDDWGHLVQMTEGEPASWRPRLRS